jgi:predicted alpha/beta-hydrolase family hydrolase
MPGRSPSRPRGVGRAAATPSSWPTCALPATRWSRRAAGRPCCSGALLGGEQRAHPPAALVLLGHPIAPPGRPRPADEAALASITCPTLVVQGDRDELGPLPVLERIAAANPRLELSVLAGTGHDLGRVENEAVDRAVDWLERLSLPAS